LVQRLAGANGIYDLKDRGADLMGIILIEGKRDMCGVFHCDVDAVR